MPVRFFCTGASVFALAIFVTPAIAAPNLNDARRQRLATTLAKAGGKPDAASPTRSAKLLNDSLAETSGSLNHIGRLLRAGELSPIAASTDCKQRPLGIGNEVAAE